VLARSGGFAVGTTGKASDMSDRTVFHVVPNANGWEVKREGTGQTEFLVDDKDNAVNHARDLARSSEPSQVLIHTRDGKIETEHTYGNDPRNIPG